ncbi:MAG: hypothetical protein WC404_04890 [Candidatus Omnitrophota bacterium]|jgi:hypothetical protein
MGRRKGLQQHFLPRNAEQAEKYEKAQALYRYINECVERIKGLILRDIEAGKIPGTIKAFSDLYDYVDATEYLLEVLKWDVNQEDKAYDYDLYFLVKQISGRVTSWLISQAVSVR